MPHMCDPWCLGKAEAREQPFPVCWAVALAGRRTGRRTGGTEKQLGPVRGPRSDLRCPGSGGGGGRASPRLTSLRNKGAFLHASPGRVCLPTAATAARVLACVEVFFFFFPSFLHFYPSFWFLISDFYSPFLTFLRETERKKKEGRNLPLQTFIRRRGRSVLPRGGGVMGVLGTLQGSRSRKLAHIQGSPTLGEAGRGSERRRLRGSLSSLDYPSQPCTWQPPSTSCFSSLAHSPAPLHPAPAPQAVPNQ